MDPCASHLIGEYFDFAKPYIDKEFRGLELKVRFVSAQLFIDCHLTSESILLLVRAEKEWDAELLARSVVEGTLKYVYMMSGTPDEMNQRAGEYWDILPSFAAIKRSERAKAILDSVENPSDVQWRPLQDVVMTDTEIEIARNNTNRQTRKTLEEQWSFSGIMRQLSHSDRPELKLFANLAHGYGNSSHLTHKDGDGVAMVWERYRREPDRQAAVTLAHAARLVSDVCSFAMLRLHFLLKACHVSPSSMNAICELYADLHAELEHAHKLFNSVEYNDSPSTAS